MTPHEAERDRGLVDIEAAREDMAARLRPVTGADVARAIMAGARDWLTVLAIDEDLIATTRQCAEEGMEPAAFAVRLLDQQGTVPAALSVLDELDARVTNAADDALDCREVVEGLARLDRRDDSRRGGGE